MRNETFHFEIKDLITQFVTAFDSIIIKRFDKNRVPQSRVQVRYVYAPKQRVLYDIVNKAQNITVPVVAVSISNVSRDETRVFNKLGGFYITRGSTEKDTKRESQFYRTPVPINITVNMSILAKFQTDMDQIISNFVPYNNPYIIISWKIPNDLVQDGFAQNEEIRSEVLWNGNITLNYPTDISSNEKYRISGDTSFVIKGWLFPYLQNSVGNIFYIDNNFRARSDITTYLELSGQTDVYPLSTGIVDTLDIVSISANPQISSLEYI